MHMALGWFFAVSPPPRVFPRTLEVSGDLALLKSRGCVLAGGCVHALHAKTSFGKARANPVAFGTCACKSAEQGLGGPATGHTLTQGYL